MTTRPLIHTFSNFLLSAGLVRELCDLVRLIMLIVPASIHTLWNGNFRLYSLAPCVNARLNHPAILHANNHKAKNLDIHAVCCDFERKNIRKNIFGH